MGEINFVICRKFWLSLFRENRFSGYLLNVYFMPSVAKGYFAYMTLCHGTVN